MNNAEKRAWLRSRITEFAWWRNDPNHAQYWWDRVIWFVNSYFDDYVLFDDEDADCALYEVGGFTVEVGSNYMKIESEHGREMLAVGRTWNDWRVRYEDYRYV